MSLFNGREWADFSFEERLAIKELSTKSFINFTQIWFELMQGDPFIVNWHHRWFANEIDRRVHGETNKSLAMALPPGSTKTEYVSIHMHAYTLALIHEGILKRFRNLSLSSGKALVERNSKRVRDIINSNEFQELWPSSFATNQAEEWIVNDEKGKAIGTMVSKPMQGQIIGSRGGYLGEGYSGAIFLDDPQKAENVFSAVQRERDHRLLTNTVRSRRGDKSKDNATPVFLIQQRLHKEDSLGFCLEGGMGIDFDLIKVPALLTQDYVDSLPDGVREDCIECTKDYPRVTIGGVEYWSFWEEMEGIDQLIDLWQRDEYTFMSQYMQSPISLAGNLVQTDWFPRYTVLPPLVGFAVYVDTNSGMVKEHNDYTVFNLCGIDQEGNLYVLDIERGKWDPEDLLAKAEECWERWSAAIPRGYGCGIRYMSVESKQAGQGLIQTLTKRNKIPVHEMPRGTGQNKYARYCNTQPQMKMGKVYLPELHDGNGDRISYSKWHTQTDAFPVDWVVPFMSELEGVTIGVLMDQETGFDDQIDTLFDAIQDLMIDNSGGALEDILTARRKRRRG
ncbi:terminase large subunit [Vibrio phage LP.1]|nr:terminase large subunit [Vibrio phage LP.1]